MKLSEWDYVRGQDLEWDKAVTPGQEIEWDMAVIPGQDLEWGKTAITRTKVLMG